MKTKAAQYGLQRFQSGDHGIQKPRGLENAALQQQKHDRPDAAIAPVPGGPLGTTRSTDVLANSASRAKPASSPPPTFPATSGAPAQQPAADTTYAHLRPSAAAPFRNNPPDAAQRGASSALSGPTAGSSFLIADVGARLRLNAHTGIDNGSNTLVAGEGSRVAVNTHVGIDNGDDVLIAGQGSSVRLNTHIGIDNGNDTIIVGPNADLRMNSHVGVDNGSDTLVVGEGASVRINSHVGVDNGSDTLVIGDGATVRINSHVGVDNGNDTVIIGDGAEVRWNSHTGTSGGNGTLILGEGARVVTDAQGPAQGDGTVSVAAGATLRIDEQEGPQATDRDTTPANDRKALGASARADLANSAAPAPLPEEPAATEEQAEARSSSANAKPEEYRQQSTETQGQQFAPGSAKKMALYDYIRELLPQPGRDGLVERLMDRISHPTETGEAQGRAVGHTRKLDLLV